MTNNVESCKKINGRVQTFRFSVFIMGRRELCRSRSLSGPDGGSSGHPDDFDDRGQKREEATAVLKMLKIRGFNPSSRAFRRLMGALVRCQTPPVVSSAENMEQIFCWKHGEDDLMHNYYEDDENQPAQ